LVADEELRTPLFGQAMTTVDVPDIVQTIANAWACEPEVSASGTSPSALHLSLLSGADGPPLEAAAAADPAYHTICYPMLRYRSEFVLDRNWSQTAKVEAGQLCLVPAGREPWGVNIGAWRSFHMYLPDAIVSEIIAADGSSGDRTELWSGPPKAFRQPDIEHVCRALYTETADGLPFSRLRIDCLAQELAIHLLRTQATGFVTLRRARSTGGLAPWQLKRAVEAMADQSLGAVSLADLARAAGCSPTHFSRAFKRSTGLTVSDWQKRDRLQRAEALLGDTRMSLAAIALALGFSAQSHFTTAFRRSSGLTPRAWRAQRTR
jgi:AraC family transcriptional regulator